MQTGTIVTTLPRSPSGMIGGDIWVYPRIAGRMRVLSKPAGRRVKFDPTIVEGTALLECDGIASVTKCVLLD